MPHRFSSRKSMVAMAEKLSDTVFEEAGTYVYPMADVHKEALLERLFDVPPSRSALAFQQKGGEAAAKHSFAPELADVVDTAADERDMEEVFCMAHGEFVRLSGVDIEHAFAHTKIKDRQADLLAFLNDNPEFAEIFCAQPKMQEFFKFDPATRQTQMTGYFCKLCFNAAGNLWLLCHACNIKKGGGGPMKWFKDQKFFGRSFVKDVNAKGGLQTGVVIDRIYKKPWGATKLKLAAGGPAVVLCSRPGQGLGAFVREWFMDKHGQVVEAHREFYVRNYGELKKQVDQILHLVDQPDYPGKAEAVGKAYGKLIKDVKRLLPLQRGLGMASADLSDSDDSLSGFTAKVRDQVLQSGAVELRNKEHEIAKVTRLIDANLGSMAAEKVWQFGEEDYQQSNPGDWSELLAELKQREDDHARHGRKIPYKEVYAVLSDFSEMLHTPEHRLAVVMQQADQTRGELRAKEAEIERLQAELTASDGLGGDGDDAAPGAKRKRRGAAAIPGSALPPGAGALGGPGASSLREGK